MEKIQVFKNGEFPAYKGPNDYFTGNVRVDNLLPNNHQSGISAVTVTFEPSAKTNWHTHPYGQLLIITSGVGEVQQWDEEIITVKAGDIVWFPPNIKHWHGATTSNAMSHISIVTPVNSNPNSAVTWLEKVSNS